MAEQVVMAIHEGKEALPSSLPVCIPLLKKESLRSLAKVWVLFITNTKSYYSFFCYGLNCGYFRGFCDDNGNVSLEL